MAPLIIVALRGRARCVITPHRSPNGSFTKCHPCSRFILLPIFPVAHSRSSSIGSDVAGRPHPVDRRLRQGPLDHGRHRFTHKSLTPPASCERITEIHGTWSHAGFD